MTKKKWIQKLAFTAAIAATSLGGSALAADFNVLTNTSSAAFTSNAPLETINGTTSELTGSVSADLDDPTSLRGSVSIPVASIRTGVDLRDEHLRGEQWLNAEANPELTFEVTSVVRRRGARKLDHGQTSEVTIVGNLTINGQTHEVSAPGQVTYYVLEGSELEGTYGIDGNVLRVMATLEISLSDFGVNVPPPVRAKVSNELTLEVRLTAAEQ